MSDRTAAGTARLLLVFLSLAWGLAWPAMRIALDEVPPISLRMMSLGLGAVILFLVAALRGRNVARPRGAAIAHTFIAPFFNLIMFGLLANFAQLAGSTARVAILAYTTPIWTSVLARFTLGERFTLLRIVGLTLCAVGISVLAYPLAQSGMPIAILLGMGAALSWSIGTIYLKWARIAGDPLVNSAWQLAAGCLTAAVMLPFFEDGIYFWPLQVRTILAVVFCGALGAGIAYFLWYEIVDRLPAGSAALGSLSVPVVGVISSAIVLGERPTMPDIVGFAFIFAAACCVLLQPAPGAAAPAPPAKAP